MTTNREGTEGCYQVDFLGITFDLTNASGVECAGVRKEDQRDGQLSVAGKQLLGCQYDSKGTHNDMFLTDYNV